MAKFIGFAFSAGVAVGMVWLAGCGAPVEEKPQAKEEIDQEFFAYLDKLAQDQGQKQKYAEVVEKLTQVVEEEAKKNPQAMSSHIEEMIRIVPKAGPGAAIQFEEYASAAVREEMNELRKDKDAAKLLEKERQIAELKKANDLLKKAIGMWESGEAKKIKKEKEISDFNAFINQLKSEMAKKDGIITEKDRQLNLNISEYLAEQNSKKTIWDKVSRALGWNELSDGWKGAVLVVGLPMGAMCIIFVGFGVAWVIDKLLVCIISNRTYSVLVWNGFAFDVGVNITRKSSKKHTTFIQKAKVSTVMKLPAGDYYGKFFVDNKYIYTTFLVKDVPSYFYKKVWYNGLICITQQKSKSL